MRRADGHNRRVILSGSSDALQWWVKFGSRLTLCLRVAMRKSSWGWRRSAPGARSVVFVAMLVDDGDPSASGRKTRTTDPSSFDMRAEIVERVGRATLDDRIGFRRERAHCGASSERERIRQVLANGTRSQSGRCASSYSIS
jgi:hypothetical protein